MKAALLFSMLGITLGLGCVDATEESMDGDGDALGTTSEALNAPITCAIQTYHGRYLTAVGGGGKATDPLHSDARWIRSWEKFTLVDPGEGSPIPYGIKTLTGNYLTANGGGGRITDVMRSNATSFRAWERFTLVDAGDGYYGIQTVNGNYLTAVGGGGRITDVIHSDATRLLNWEKFKFLCGPQFQLLTPGGPRGGAALLPRR